MTLAKSSMVNPSHMLHNIPKVP